MTLAGSFNGLAFGPLTKIHVSNISGLDDLPTVVSSDARRYGDHGYFQGQDLLDGRQILLELTLIGDDNPDYLNLQAQCRQAFIIQSTPGTWGGGTWGTFYFGAGTWGVGELPLLLNGNTKLVKCRPRHYANPYEADRLARTGVFLVDLFASDPRIYDANLSAPTTALTGAPLGTGFNMAFNVGFGGAVVGGYIQATNVGTFPTRPVATITGPVTNPRIELVTASKAVKFTLTMVATDSLVVDFDARTAVLNGTSSRRSALTTDSNWFELAPGLSTLRYTGDTYDPTSQLTLSYRSAWV